MQGHVGFTGTQNGCTYAQLCKLDELLSDPSFQFTHSGDCVGADEDFHGLSRARRLYTIGHPPLKRTKRSFCTYDKEREPKDYLDRNKDIVDACETLIATPKGYEEELRSGTWSTIRWARKKEKIIAIVWPDGSVTWENVKKTVA